MTRGRKNTEGKKRRLSKKGRQKKLFRRLIILGVVVFLALGGYGLIDSMITGMYNKGQSVSKDIRTAEKIKDDVVNILVCGLDWEDGRSAMMADVIMYVTIDVKANKVSAFQIPRDTYITDDIPTGGSNKINASYWHGKDKENRVFNTIQVVNKKLGLAVDHYVTLNMDAFIAMVDAIDDGLEMYVPCPIILEDKSTGKTETIIDVPGWYKVNGETAEAIVRNRNYPGGDVQRLEVQSYFYAALVKNFMETLNISDFIKILPRFTQHITTDMHWTKIASLAQVGFSMKYQDMAIVKPAVHGYVMDGKSIVTAEKQEWANILNQYFRPYQSPLSAGELKMDAPVGTIETDYGITQSSIQTIADILNKSPAN